MMQYQFYVVQHGYAVFGCGNNDADAIADANSNIERDSPIYPLTLDGIARFSGRAKPSTPHPSGSRKPMTNQGELVTGSMILLDDETAEALGYEDVQ